MKKFFDDSEDIFEFFLMAPLSVSSDFTDVTLVSDDTYGEDEEDEKEVFDDGEDIFEEVKGKL